MKIHGNIVDHEYEIERKGTTVATVPKKWFRVRDTHGIEVRQVAEAPLVFVTSVALDAMTHA